jgi:membrane protease YdiL (CAAX protease family)
MALAFERSRSVYAAMLVHAAYNGSVATLMLLQ